MPRADRLLELIDILRRHRGSVTGARLAEELGVSLRSLYRDIEALRGRGADIEGEAGFGYVLKPGFLLPPLMFAQSEIEALVLGSRWVAKRGDPELAAAAARALAADRITVNAFAPGVVRTELWAQLDREFLSLGLTDTPDQAINEFSQSILLGRSARPEDITGVTTFLASAGSDYITGQTYMVDGGMVLI